ncbi:MAG TPA: hypothetical protein VE863_17355 [Pyrinomonadaceae bacterium]|jgi:hypothetical protein|nr:hypothetical protein [Pyrinomonadaceae bacterium]
MTNSTTTLTTATQQNYPTARKSSDAAPMVITRLSGWIDINEMKAEPRGWIVPTRIHQAAR